MNESNNSEEDISVLLQRAKLAVEENAGLKAYIASMNNECLELNAALFEEANKRVGNAMRGQYLAEKQAKELIHQNDVLQSEVRALKAMIADLPIPVVESQMALPKPKSRSHRNRAREADMQSVPVLYRQSCGNLSTLDRSSIDSTLSRVKRSVLLEAMLTDADFESPDRSLFREFLDWIKMGCPLNLTSFTPVNGMRKPRVLIVREDAHGDHVDQSRTPSISPIEQSNFIRLLLNEDVQPCLRFEDAKLTDAIYRALPNCALEMVPLGQKTMSDSSEDNWCPLIPSHDTQYLLSLHNTTGERKVRISSAARNRIAAVANLFQYLSLIKRGLASTNKQTTERDNARPQHSELPELERQFRKIQRLRLVIAFARLGFGVPDAD